MTSFEQVPHEIPPPGELFIHEAGHALAYDATGLPLTSCSVYIFQNSRDDRGSTKISPREADATLPTHAFIQMCGPAAHIFVANKAFSSTSNRFFTDFSVLVRSFRGAFRTDLEVTGFLTKLRIISESVCREWVLANREPILRFASLLERSLVSPGVYELSGERLKLALSEAWSGPKPVLNEADFEKLTLPILAKQSAVPDDWLPWLENFTGRIQSEQSGENSSGS